MLIADDAVQLREAVAKRLEVGVIVDPTDASLVADAAAMLSVDVDAMRVPAPGGVPRPSISVHEDQHEAVLFSFTESNRPTGIALIVSPVGLLAVTTDLRCASLVREALTRANDRAQGVSAVFTAVASDIDDHLRTLTDRAKDLDDQPARLNSSSSRQRMSELRRHLLVVEQVCDAQARVLHADDVLTDADAAASKELRRAATDFASSAALASRLYAALGDALAEQRAVISERLTLINAVFLPLTLGGAVFGMNFGWLGEHIGSATAFWLLGIAAPIGLMVVTVLGIRRIGA